MGDRNLFFKKQIRFSHPAAVVIIVLLPLDSSYSSKIHSYSLDINYTNYLINRRPTTKWLKRLHRGDVFLEEILNFCPSNTETWLDHPVLVDLPTFK